MTFLISEPVTNHEAAKVCVRCEALKPLSDFPPQKKGRAGLHSSCRPCKLAYQREQWRKNYVPHPRPVLAAKVCSHCKVEKPIEDFHLKRGKASTGRQAYCIECSKARRREHLYDMGQEDVASLALAQSGCCGICDKPLTEKMVVDHCHDTGAVRGLLCNRCNVLLRGVEDAAFLNGALQYLASPPAADMRRTGRRRRS